MKAGSEVSIFGEVRRFGALIDITGFSITASARKNSDTGDLVGNFVLTHLSIGKYQLTLNTDNIPPCQLHADTRITDTDGHTVITETVVVPLKPAITPVPI